MNCRNCGTQLPEGTQVCTTCGALQEEVSSAAPTEVHQQPAAPQPPQQGAPFGGPAPPPGPAPGPAPGGFGGPPAGQPGGFAGGPPPAQPGGFAPPPGGGPPFGGQGYQPSPSPLAGLAPAAIATRAVAVVCALAIPLLLLAPYVSGGSQSLSGWQFFSSKDILMTLCGVAIAALIAVDLFGARSRALLWAAAAVAFVTLGLSWADFGPAPVSWDVGAYFVLLFALAECAALVVALLGPERPPGAPPGRP